MIEHIMFCSYAEDPRVPFGTYTYPKLTGASRDAHARLMKLTNKYLMDTMCNNFDIGFDHFSGISQLLHAMRAPCAMHAPCA